MVFLNHVKETQWREDSDVFSLHGNFYDLGSALSADLTLAPSQEDKNHPNPTLFLPGSKTVFPFYSLL